MCYSSLWALPCGNLIDHKSVTTNILFFSCGGLLMTSNQAMEMLAKENNGEKNQNIQHIHALLPGSYSIAGGEWILIALDFGSMRSALS